jgi:hypothetical protein
MKAAVEVFIPTSEERPRFGPVEWMWKAESSESYDSDTWRNEQIKDRDSRDDLFQDQMIHLFVRLGGLTRIGQIRGKQPIKERSDALSDAVHDAELPTS